MWTFTGKVTVKDEEGKEHQIDVDFYPGVPQRDLTDEEMAEVLKAHPDLDKNGYFVRASGRGKTGAAPVTEEGAGNGDN